MRPRVVRYLLIATGVLLATFFTFQSHVAGRWQEMIAIADRLQARIEARDSKRPVLYGEAMPGDAWADYSTAISLVAAKDHDLWSTYQTQRRQGDSEAVRRARDAFLEGRVEALAALHRGAHRESARYPVDWQEHKSPYLLKTRVLANVAVLQAQRHLDEGHPELAVGALLDATQFARDTMRAPILIDELIGMALLGIPTKEALFDQQLLDRFPFEQLEELRRGMRIIDDSISVGTIAMHGEVVLFVRRVTGSDIASLWGESENPSLMAWRYGFSTRLMIANYVSDAEHLADDFTRQDAEPWPARRGHLKAAANDLQTSPNPLTRILAVNTSSFTVSRLWVIARMRLARMAVEYRVTGEVHALPDPFGGELRFDLDNGVLRLWTRGPTGTPVERRHVLEIPVSRPEPSGR